MAHSPVAILFTTASGGQSIATIDSNLGYLLGVTGSVGVNSSITGSVNITNTLLNITGSVGVVSPLTGSFNVTNSLFNVTGSVGITNQVRITTTGSIPVSDNGSSLTVDTPQLPAALVGARLDINNGAWLGSTAPTVGQKTMAASIPVAFASDQTVLAITTTGSIPVSDGGGSLTVDGVFFQATQPVSAVSLPLPTGAATAALQTQPGIDIGDVTVNNGAGAAAVNIQDGGNSITIDGIVGVSGSVAVTGPLTDAQLRAVAVPVSVASLPLPAGAATEATLATRAAAAQFPAALVGARLDINNGAWLGSTAPTVGQKTAVNSIPVVLASDGTGGSIGVQGIVSDGAAIGTTKPVVVGGFDGANAQTLLTDVQGRLVIAPSGASTATKGFSTGKVVLSATTVVPIRETTYTEQTTNAQRSIASAAAADTAAGTGARTAKITYYTATFTGPFTETVTLNGVVFVSTVAVDICYIEKIEVMTVGSGGVNAGILTLKAATGGGGATISTVAASANRTNYAHHYVPTGKTCNVTGFLVGILGADTMSALLRSRILNIANSAEIQVSDQVRAPSSGQSFRDYGTPIQVTGPAIITAFAAPDSSSSRTYIASFDFYEE